MKNEKVNFFDKFSSFIINNINVCMIAKIQSYNPSNNTATVIPMHMVPGQNTEYPPLAMVPIGNFCIGGYRIKVKPKKGDVVILLFADYDIDNILTNGKTKKHKTDREHSLQDAIALPLSINFLNNAYNAEEDLIISKENSTSYIKITEDDEIIINSNIIKLGEEAMKFVRLEDGSTSTKVQAE